MQQKFLEKKSCKLWTPNLGYLFQQTCILCSLLKLNLLHPWLFDYAEINSIISESNLSYGKTLNKNITIYNYLTCWLTNRTSLNCQCQSKVIKPHPPNAMHKTLKDEFKNQRISQLHDSSTQLFLKITFSYTCSFSNA